MSKNMRLVFKRFKKITGVLLLTVVIMASLLSCSKEDPAPDPMDRILVIPTSIPLNAMGTLNVKVTGKGNKFRRELSGTRNDCSSNYSDVYNRCPQISEHVIEVPSEGSYLLEIKLYSYICNYFTSISTCKNTVGNIMPAINNFTWSYSIEEGQTGEIIAYSQDAISQGGVEQLCCCSPRDAYAKCGDKRSCVPVSNTSFYEMGNYKGVCGQTGTWFCPNNDSPDGNGNCGASCNTYAGINCPSGWTCSTTSGYGICQKQCTTDNDCPSEL